MLVYEFLKDRRSNKNKLGPTVLDGISERLVQTATQICPQLNKEQILKLCTIDVTKYIKDNNQQFNLEEAYNIVSEKIINIVSTKSPDPAALQTLNAQIQEEMKDIKNVQKIEQHVSDITKNITFTEKMEMAKTCHNLLKFLKNELNILALGLSQVGKTALVKRLFNLSDKDLKLKGGIQSDSIEVKTYTYIINGVKLNYTDCPGYQDSRGFDVNEENKKKILEHIKKNQIDIIFWVSKIGDIIDLNQLNLLKYLNENLGHDIWRRTVIVLTHANDEPPDEYYYNANGEMDPSIPILTAWNKYINSKKENWKSTVIDKMELDAEHILPIVLVENSIMKAKQINNVRVLIDGTPILETLMIEIFKLINIDKTPLLFLALANEDLPSPVVSPPSPVINPPNPAPVINPPSPAPRSVNQEIRTALDQATNRLILNSMSADTPKKKRSWCPLF